MTSTRGISLSSLAIDHGRRSDHGNRLLSTIFFLSPLATSAVPRLTPVFFAILAISLIGAALRRGLPWRDLVPRNAALAACLLLAVYVVINATWSPDRSGGLGKAALLAGLVVLTFPAVTASLGLDESKLRRAALWFAAGAFLGAVFLVIEFLTEGILTRFVLSWMPLLHPVSPKHVKIEHGEITGLNLSKLDQNVNLAMFHLWPGLLALMQLTGSRRTIAMLLFFVIIAVVIALSEHDSSQVALIGSSLVVLLAWHWRRCIVAALAVLWCAAFLLVIPAGFAAYQNGLHMASWLPKSARARIILWEYTAEQTLTHPLLGSGVEATPVLNKQQKAARQQPGGFIYPRTIGHHAHNIFLHTWSELGAVGAVLLAIAGAAVVLLIYRLTVSAQPFAAGAFAAFALVGAFAWGMWQSWFMCAVALVPLYLRISAGVVSSSSSEWRSGKAINAFAKPQTSARSTRSAANFDGQFGVRPISTVSAQA
jgi:O-antigen ligase